MKLMASTAVLCIVPKAVNAIEAFFTPKEIEPNTSFDTPEHELIATKAKLEVAENRLDNLKNVLDEADSVFDAAQKTVKEEKFTFGRTMIEPISPIANAEKKDIGKPPAEMDFDSYESKPMPSLFADQSIEAVRKKKDMTPMFRAHYDGTKLRHTLWVAKWKGVPRNKSPNTNDLRDDLNKEFELNKSISVYSRIWNDTNEELIYLYPHAPFEFAFEGNI